jgi:hypothetical protein
MVAAHRMAGVDRAANAQVRSFMSRFFGRRLLSAVLW